MKYCGNPNFLALSADDRAKDLQRAAETVASMGTTRSPDPPRGIVAQSGARKSVLAWDAPALSADISGYRIYKDTEASIVATVDARQALRYELPLSSGATPETTNIFISSVNAGGKESARIQVQCAAIAEVAAPSDPQPPSGVTRQPRTSKLYWEGQ